MYSNCSPSEQEPGYPTNTWCNRDLIPIPSHRRTWTSIGYIGYWTVSGSCVSGWTIGSTVLAYGLSAPQAIGSVVVGGVLVGLLAISCGRMGQIHHIGFTVSARFSYGFYGSFVPIIFRALVASLWFGIQAYWGGQATKALIGAVIPGFINGALKEEFGGSHLTKNDFIGTVIWGIGFCILLLIPPEKMQVPFFLSFISFVGTCFGLLGWSVGNAGGVGPLFHQPSSSNEVGWGFLFGITGLLGAWSTGCLGQSDWTRYSKTKSAPLISQLVAAPITITVTAIIGILVTSATESILGELIWSPIVLLPRIQHYYHDSAGARAGVFFASIGLVCSQMAINIVLNSVSTGMDIAGLCPKYLNIRRGSYIMAAIGICSQPWQLLATASKYLTLLSGFAIFITPMIGVMLADYFAVRRGKLRICDLYQTSNSIYFYHKGFNWRGFFSVAMGVWPFFPGFISAAGHTDPAVGWIRLYKMAAIMCIVISFSTMVVVSYLFPPPGLGLEAPFIEQDEMDSISSQEQSKTLYYSKSSEDPIISSHNL